VAPTGRWARRHTVGGLTFLACLLGYTDRVNISVAAVAMQDELHWTQTQKGLVLSSFFIGDMLFMFASGWLANRFGGKRVLGVAVLTWSACTLLTPAAAATSLPTLVAVRIAMGIGEAGMFPACYELYGRWVPATETTRAVARLMSAIPVGTVVGLMVTGWIVARFSWPPAFYAFGALGMVWVAIWSGSVRNDPARDPRISAPERALLAPSRPRVPTRSHVPWRLLLLRAPVWAMVSGHFATTWSLYVLLSWLPSYFKEVQGLTIGNAGLFSAAPWLAAFVMTHAAGSVSDGMIRRGVSVTFTRKLMQCGGLIVSAAFLLATRGVHSPALALVLLCGATGALGCTNSGFAANGLDLAPRHAALVFGFSNTFATIPGIVGVAVTGWLVQVTGTYSAAFALTAAVSVVGAVAYVVLFDASRPVVT
jgi:ACS family sodium-dependent inorganic phosphate cotransporter